MRKVIIGVAVGIAVLAAAFWYVSTPDIPRSVLEKRYETGASQMTTLPDGARVNFRDQGPRDAPVLLLIHGSNASLFTWEPWVLRMNKTFRVVTVDMPGHGLTGAVPNGDYSLEGMVKFTDEFANRLGLQKFALGGNSMGGAIAARYAEEHPDRVTHLILVDAGGMPSKQGDHVPIAFKLARIPVVNQIMLYITPRSMVKEGLDDAFYNKRLVSDWMIDRYWDFARMEGTREATLKRFEIPWDTSIKDHIGDIKAPTLILWGAEDHLIPVEAAHEYNEAIKGSKLIVYPNAGHVLQEDAPDATVKDVRAFLTAP